MKKIIFVIFVVLILLIAVGYVIFTKKYQLITSSKLPPISESQIQGWGTYKNAQYGFEIRYPSGWKFEEPAMYTVNFYPPETQKLFANDKRYPMVIDFHKIKKVNVDYKLKSQMDRKKYKMDNGIEIIKFTPITKESMLNAIIFVNDKVYEVFVDGFEGNNRDIFDKMLPTIKPVK